MAKMEFTTKIDVGQAPKHHFFLSSVGTWRTGYDLPKLIKMMQAEKMPFNVFLVPGESSSPYKIRNFSPQVEGSVWIGAYAYQD